MPEPCPPIVPLSTVDFVDRAIAAEVRRIEGIFNAQLESRDRAIAIQTKELERRLEELNHAHSKAQQDKQDFLAKSTFEPFLKGYQIWSRGVDTFMANSQGRTAAYVSVGVVLGIVMNIVFRFWK